MSNKRSYSYIAEREINIERLRFLERKKERLIKQGGPSVLSSNTSYLDADNIRGFGNNKSAISLFKEIIAVQIEIEEIKRDIDTIDDCIETVKTALLYIDKSKEKVKYLKMCGYNLREIAEELDLSYDHVRMLSSKIEKERKDS